MLKADRRLKAVILALSCMNFGEVKSPSLDGYGGSVHRNVSLTCGSHDGWARGDDGV